MTKDELKAMTDDAVLRFALQRRGESLINDARLRFRHHYASMEQAFAQVKPLSNIKAIRMEFEAVIDILETGGERR